MSDQRTDSVVRRLYAHSCSWCPLRGANGCNFCATNPVTDAPFAYPDTDWCPMARGEAVLVSRVAVIVLTPAQVYRMMTGDAESPAPDAGGEG